MSALPLTLTTAGLQRFTAAQIDDEIDLTISRVGLTDRSFVAAPTLTALPGRFRDVETISGEAVGSNIVHLMIRDDSAATYSVRGFGLFLEDGTLFAAYGQAEPIFQKAPAAAMLIALDLAFPTSDIDQLTFGDTDFLNPPGTEDRAGVLELADGEEIAAGHPTRAVSARRLRDSLRAWLPIGAIAMWFGSAATVPEGWAICNGQAVPRSDGAGNITTPDLRDRAVVGAGTRAVNTPFGAAEKTVRTADAGSHTHQVEIPGHTHGAGSLAATVDSAKIGATLAYTTKTDTAGGGSGKTIAVPPDSGAVPPGINDPGHQHSASMSGSTAAGGAATIATASDGLHAHQVTIDVTPPSYALHFIMRV